MQVQQLGGTVDKRSYFPGALQLRTAARPIELRRGPHPIEVLIHKARVVGAMRIECRKSSHVAENRGDTTPPRLHAAAQKGVERHGARVLVAMHKGCEQNLRPRCLRCTFDHIRRTATGFSPTRQFWHRNLQGMWLRRSSHVQLRGAVDPRVFTKPIRLQSPC